MGLQAQSVIFYQNVMYLVQTQEHGVARYPADLKPGKSKLLTAPCINRQEVALGIVEKVNIHWGPQSRLPGARASRIAGIQGWHPRCAKSILRIGVPLE
jgi:hypothetical protein